MRQNNPYTGGGRGFVMNGAFKQGGSPNSIAMATLNDPTPHASEDFGTSSAGIGNVAGDGRNEIMVGAYGPHNPGTNQAAVNDVHIFSALDEEELQRIEAPDKQAGAGFGTALAPLGDLNGDGFLDFAVGAGLWDGPTGADQGRIYIFRSDNKVPAAVHAAVAGRAVELLAVPRAIRRGARVTLRGVVEAFANGSACAGAVDVELQRHSLSSPKFTTFATVKTDDAGAFAQSVRPRATTFYRAVVHQTETCLGAASDREQVTVR